MSPQWSNLILSTDIPYSERNVLVFDSLDVEAFEVKDGGSVLYSNAAFDQREPVVLFFPFQQPLRPPSSVTFLKRPILHSTTRQPGPYRDKNSPIVGMVVTISPSLSLYRMAAKSESH
jgi:hypothetical protein